ncbi:unnamed protein product [Euphydryas editha]|uniref:Cytadhesion n=2 Tax=Euphydryas editha TaxID=104508 RepID=A0AAU9TPU6_EUPED|nr:unnamed protein product [Euphydryas editha]
MEPGPSDVPLPEPIVVIPIPNEMLRLIPYFGGDKRHLNIFLRKCEYVINKYRGHEEQNIYVLHAITSRLTDNAAALLSEREDITTWSALKELLEQHFGDPRSEECINIELESCKIKTGESYLDFCNRIQNIRSLLISKVNLLTDADIKRAKIAIYNHTALNVFLYNLPEHLVRVVRLNKPATLEQALSIVMEEVNFHEQYATRNRTHGGLTTPRLPANIAPVGFKFGNTTMTSQNQNGYKPLLPNSFVPQQRFSFGMPPNRFQFGQQQNHAFKPQQFGNRLPQFGYRPQLGSNTQFGFRPQLEPQRQFGYKPPQIGFKPPQFHNNPQQFGYKPPQLQGSRFQETDVSMRTAVPRSQPQTPQQSFRLNELTLGNDDLQDYYDTYNNDGYEHDTTYRMYDYDSNLIDYNDESEGWKNEDLHKTEGENFHIEASPPKEK